MIKPALFASGRSPPERSGKRSLRTYVEASLLVGAATGAGLLMAPRLGTDAVDLLYLVPVLAAASLYGVRQGLFAGASSALAYNFFFTSPLHTFRIDDPRNVVTVLMLFVVAIVTSQLAARMRRQAELATASAGENAILAGFARRLLSGTGESDVGAAACAEVGRLFDANTVLVVKRESAACIVASEPENLGLSPINDAAAAAALDSGEVAGRRSGRFNAADWTFHPIRTQNEILGVMGLARDDGLDAVGAGRLSLLTSLLDQAALALERTQLEAEMIGVSQLRERDRLRGALLSSVGHDLRTPLTAILASAAEIRRQSSGSDASLLDTLEGEARRLDRLVANLLDMARVEAGAIKLNSEAIDLTDAVASAAHDVRRSLADHSLIVEVPPDLPLVMADPQLLHHCLINLLDNAGRYSNPATPILVSAWRTSSGLSLAVSDEGPGIPTGEEMRIFESFSRIEGSDRKGGSGLGLAIVRGFATAMGFGVEAARRASPKGAQFVLHFPERLVVADDASWGSA